MGYASLHAAISDLEKHGHLVRITEPISTELEMAAVHRQVRAMSENAPALFFENIIGAEFPAVSNIFGTVARAEFLFRDALEPMRKLLSIRENPANALKPHFAFSALRTAMHALPRPAFFWRGMRSVDIQKVPVTKSWVKDGGNFVTLPLVYSENPESPGILKSNLGMYRIQTSGNEFISGKTMGMHYQLHRGIGIHHTAAIRKNAPLQVSVLVGGPPALMFAAVMPLPENLSEILFASMLNRRAFSYRRDQSFLSSPQIDFVIQGTVEGSQTAPEGPFGDHLGYYSLQHDFPLLHVKKILARRKNAIWPFTVVGRPPQEDSVIGHLIHNLAGPLVSRELPGVLAAHAVDAAGVHPLLLVLGTERYLPYAEAMPREILTQANAVLGFNQMSLAKYLFITADEGKGDLSPYKIAEFLIHILERIDFTRDLHFQTRTTMDTLDYSGTRINEGSKLVVAAYGSAKRKLAHEMPSKLSRYSFREVKLAFPGVLTIRTTPFRDYKSNEYEMRSLASAARDFLDQGIVMMILVDDVEFAAKSLDNLIWVTFTRSDPARDIYGVESFIEHKHWGCKGPLIIDARVKHHHAGVLVEDEKVSQNIQRFFKRGASLSNIEKR